MNELLYIECKYKDVMHAPNQRCFALLFVKTNQLLFDFIISLRITFRDTSTSQHM